MCQALQRLLPYRTTMTVNHTVNLNAGGGLESGVHQYMAANRRFSEDLLRNSKAALS